jgi:UDP-glucose 4-epimerase
MHFAAYAYVGESTIEPIKQIGDTICCAGTGKYEVFAFKRNSCLEQLRGATNVGIVMRLPLVENDPQRPVNPYGHTKLAVERLFRDSEIAHGIRSVTLSYFNAAGADPDGELGELHEPETHLTVC